MSSNDILAQLTAREPVFHRPAFARTRDDFDRLMAPGYWEIGASGKCYSRDFILLHLTQNPPVDAASARWQTFDHLCRPLGHNTFLFTYTLHQGERHTRRSTIWQHNPGGWQILYHQGTIIQNLPDESPS